MTAGWGEAQAAKQPVANGWGSSEAEWAVTGNGSQWDDGTDYPMASAAAPSALPLYIGAAVALVGLASAVLLRAGWFLVLSWLASGVVPVALVAVYQLRDLRAATSMWYVPDQAAKFLRVAVLCLGGL